MNRNRAAKAKPRRGPGAFARPEYATGLAAAAILLLLAFFGRLGWSDAVLGTGAIAAIMLIATRLITAPAEQEADAQPETGVAPAVAHFADTLTQPCLIVNDRAVLIYRNPAAAQQFPRARLGDPLAFTLRDPDLVEAVDRALLTKAAQHVEVHLTVPNDTWYRAAVVPYRAEGEDGDDCVAITLFDFTEQKRTDRMRADFVANASHELRTPLTSLMGFIDTLQGSAAKDEAARARFLGIMRNQAERMSGLIDDLLSLSRIELRQHVKPTTEVNLNLLLREVAEGLEPRLEEAKIKLNLDLPDTPITVIGDRQELFEVLENLADNAIKYGGSGGRVDITLTPGASRTGAHHAITVTDYGPGIAQEHVPRLTERFYRVDAESSRKKKGTGLGLAIVKHIVSRHHGEMTIRSTVGEGTRVEVLLPR
ncbi:sensor histidine kinase [Pelagibacterium halotolerans]|uniref:sensor histidine kinase n=1 Tax=Pelagibacterium halotolerans TaxID=531813 RepID=UPI0038507126